MCLNLVRPSDQAPWSEEPDGVIAAARHCIVSARGMHWPVFHVHNRPDQSRARDVQTISGLEPLVSEPLFYKESASLFSAASLPDRLDDLDIERLVLIGFALAFDCLASCVIAAERGLQPIVIRDAVACDWSRTFNQPLNETPSEATFIVLSRFARLESAHSMFGGDQLNGARGSNI